MMRALILVLVLLLARSAWAVPATCNLFSFTGVAEEQLGVPTYLLPGDVVRAVLTFGAASITNGTHGDVSRVRWDLDCADTRLPCSAWEPDVVFDSSTAISSTCAGVTWTADKVDGQGGEVTFTATPPLELTAGVYSACKLAFNVRVASLPSDGRLDVYTVGGFVRGDARCDNGLTANWIDPLPQWQMCPTCKPGFACDQQTGLCAEVTTPTPFVPHVVVNVGPTPTPGGPTCQWYPTADGAEMRCTTGQGWRVVPQ